MNDWVTKVLLGVFCLVLGIIGFLYIQNDTKKGDTLTFIALIFMCFLLLQ